MEKGSGAGYFGYDSREFSRMTIGGLQDNIALEQASVGFADKFVALSAAGVTVGILGFAHGLQRRSRLGLTASMLGVGASAICLVSGIVSGGESRRNVMLMQVELERRGNNSRPESA